MFEDTCVFLINDWHLLTDSPRFGCAVGIGYGHVADEADGDDIGSVYGHGIVRGKAGDNVVVLGRDTGKADGGGFGIVPDFGPGNDIAHVVDRDGDVGLGYGADKAYDDDYVFSADFGNDEAWFNSLHCAVTGQ